MILSHTHDVQVLWMCISSPCNNSVRWTLLAPCYRWVKLRSESWNTGSGFSPGLPDARPVLFTWHLLIKDDFPFFIQERMSIGKGTLSWQLGRKDSKGEESWEDCQPFKGKPVKGAVYPGRETLVGMGQSWLFWRTETRTFWECCWTARPRRRRSAKTWGVWPPGTHGKLASGSGCQDDGGDTSGTGCQRRGRGGESGQRNPGHPAHPRSEPERWQGAVASDRPHRPMKWWSWWTGRHASL